ncbi:MAG: DODA-type extradiol aromatic ring-opening family dioxygenase [Candidatus Thorarchaeota archaeon]
MVNKDVLPSIYIGHGSPTNAIETGKYQTDVAQYASSIDDISAIVAVSAHWEQYIPLQITSASIPGVIYDFYGFPDEMYRLEYNAPGNPKLAIRIARMLKSKGWETTLNSQQGLDHGTWVPLRLMYPEADIPVLQLSIPIPRSPENMFKIGAILSPLREEGILFMGSGNLIHNLPYVMYQLRQGKLDPSALTSSGPVDDWAQETDEWIKERLDNLEVDRLLQAPEKAPNFKMAAPTTEHFDPIYFVLGTLRAGETVHNFHEGIQAGSLSMRSFALEA